MVMGRIGKIKWTNQAHQFGRVRACRVGPRACKIRRDHVVATSETDEERSNVREEEGSREGAG
jgi:hypothetical protein